MECLKFGSFSLQKFTRAYYLAIPKTWIESLGLDKGTKLEVEMDEKGNLVVKKPDGGI